MIHNLYRWIRVFSLGIALLLIDQTAPKVLASAIPSTSPYSSTSPYPLAIAAGLDHTCALMNNQSVMCWGSNRYGQLGNNALSLHPFPILVQGLSGVVTLSAGSYHTCGLLSDGSVDCWGLNTSGQLGNDTTTNSSTPVAVNGLSHITQIAAGYAYTCAVINGGSSGTVACWGDNTFGQLGNGTANTTPVKTPETISGLTGVVQVSGGLDHTCALKSDYATIECWGKNNYGQLGTESTTSSYDPVMVHLSVPSGSVQSVAAGAQHTCALMTNGTVECWGDGSLGQMGNNGPNLSQNPTPGLVYQLTGAIALSAGGNADTGHTCALTNAGGIECWGSNVYGQLGDGSNTDRNAPVEVSGLSSGVLAIAVGVDHSCALLANNTMDCWGDDGVGQLGDGVVSINPNEYILPSFTSAVTQLGMGDVSTCALAAGQAYCWGNNENGQLGTNTRVNQSSPTPVVGLSGSITALDGGANETCAIADGGVDCWGNLDPTTNAILSPTPIGNLSSAVTSLSVTSLHGCAVVSGAAWCWGDNASGDLGDNTTLANYASAVPVTGLSSGVAMVTTGQSFSCALKGNGSVWCWGDNSFGQLGQDPAVTSASGVPLQVAGLSSVAAMAAAQNSICVILQGGGAVKCWGNNAQGQLGNNSQTSSFQPVQVVGLTSGVSVITAGGYHVCALQNGGVQCWGFNSFGQLGNGLTTFSKVPVTVTGLTTGVVGIAAGGVNYDEEHTCALLATGQVAFWGGDKYGQLGDNLPIQRSTPVQVLGLTGAPEIGTNYPSGKPGSTFRVAITGFPASTPLAIMLHGYPIGTVLSSPEGYAIFHLRDITNREGLINITVSATSQVSDDISLDANASLHIQEGSGTVFINPIWIYLPQVYR
jgi:alpha-tubulin suppressor-like RCC1 family protein